MKNNTNFSWTFFFFFSNQEGKKLRPSALGLNLKNDMKMKRKKYVEFCLFISPALRYINQPESFED